MLAAAYRTDFRQQEGDGQTPDRRYKRAASVTTYQFRETDNQPRGGDDAAAHHPVVRGTESLQNARHSATTYRVHSLSLTSATHAEFFLYTYTYISGSALADCDFFLQRE